MSRSVVGEGNSRPVLERDAVELEPRHAPADAARVLDDDVVTRRAVSKRDREPVPSRRDAWVEHESRAREPEAEQPFDPGAIQPSRGPGIPGPAATADVRPLGIDVARDDVWLDLVSLDAFRCGGV